jgi:hypothetical protein
VPTQRPRRVDNQRLQTPQDRARAGPSLSRAEQFAAGVVRKRLASSAPHYSLSHCPPV